MSWQTELSQNYTRVQDLLPHIQMADDERRQMEELLQRFPMSVTPYYLSLINWDDPDDPIRRMSIPSLEETDAAGRFDTSGEAENTVLTGVQHKYAQTAMVLSTNQCAMYCRHCFRRRLVGTSDEEVAAHFEEMRAYVQQHTEITNVLLSGGDALLNENTRLEKLLSLFADIPHLDAIRVASRTPVVFPARITDDDALIAILERYNSKKQLIFITHFNHPRELTSASLAALRRVRQLAIPVKNQAVLLRGVNDDPDTLAALLRGLVAAGVEPYYLFQCRPVAGVQARFQVPLAAGWQVVNEAKARQSGLGKAFRYCLSHTTGKVEILGPAADGKEGEMLFQYHEAHDASLLGRLFTQKLAPGQAWLAD